MQNPAVEVRRHANRGHGQTCLAGYRVAVERGIPFVFQIDSDGQCIPQFFESVWNLRQNHDVVYGVRTCREDGWRRAFASKILRFFLRVVAGVWCEDANTPYRLMRTECLADVLDRVPPDFFLANIAVAVLLKRNSRCRHAFAPIRFAERIGGEPAVPFAKFGHRAHELYQQLRTLV